MNPYDRFQVADCPLFDIPPPNDDELPPHKFDGKTFDIEQDGERLTGQLHRVYDLMRDGFWRTLEEIAISVGGSEAGVSARLRDFRKDRFGGHTVERRRRGDGKRGHFEYRLVREQ